MDNIELVQQLNKELQTEFLQNISEDDLFKKLSEFINHLIKTDFQKLVTILYKTDVSENKLKQLLQQNSYTDASIIISKLIIEREQQKIISRSEFRNRSNIPEEEKW
jgi:predicted HAD superfamily phosphohydrolase